MWGFNPLHSKTLSSPAPHPQQETQAQPRPSVRRLGWGGDWQEEESGRQAGSGPTHTLPLQFLVLLPRAPPSFLGFFSHPPPARAPWKTRNRRKHRLGSPTVGTAPSPGVGAWLGSGCPSPGSVPVWRGKLELGGGSRGPYAKTQTSWRCPMSHR